MTREDLESRIRIRWEPVGDRSERCVAELELAGDCCVDIAVAAMADLPWPRFREMVEGETRRRLLESVLGDLESRNLRLRAALEKWGRRAISRQFPGARARTEHGGEEEELKEDLR